MCVCVCRFGGADPKTIVQGTRTTDAAGAGDTSQATQPEEARRGRVGAGMDLKGSLPEWIKDCQVVPVEGTIGTRQAVKVTVDGAVRHAQWQSLQLCGRLGGDAEIAEHNRAHMHRDPRQWWLYCRQHQYKSFLFNRLATTETRNTWYVCPECFYTHSSAADKGMKAHFDKCPVAVEAVRNETRRLTTLA